MDLIPEHIKALANGPREALALELKAWISPTTPQGIAKIVAACLALRNNGGGLLLVGFDDATGASIASSDDVRAQFHPDIVQAALSKYASEPFEVSTYFLEIDGTDHPILEVPPGVRTPIATKSDIKDGDVFLLRANRIFVRSLTANGRVSTSEATWRDWPRLMEVCLENREADIGRFLRRHLVGLTPQSAAPLLEILNAGLERPESGVERADAVLERGANRWNTVVMNRPWPVYPKGWLEVAVAVDTPLPAVLPSQDFLSSVMARNPQLSGWPAWVDSRGLAGDARPYVFEDGWEALVVADAMVRQATIVDFWRIESTGNLYLRRGLPDDLQQWDGAPSPGQDLDFAYQITWVAEAIAVAVQFIRGMTSDESRSIAIVMRWSGLRGRQLASWATDRTLLPGRRAVQDLVRSEASFPLETSQSAIQDVVRQLVIPLFVVFDGFAVDPKVLDDLVQQRLTRRV